MGLFLLGRGSGPVLLPARPDELRGPKAMLKFPQQVPAPLGPEPQYSAQTNSFLPPAPYLQPIHALPDWLQRKPAEGSKSALALARKKILRRC